MIIGVIPARGGSKRIPRKNIRQFSGRPIIEYSIQAAIGSRVFDEIIVSTDDDEIAAVAESCGASVPFRRPADLSGDTVGSNRVMKHAIEWCGENLGDVTHTCMLTATAPFLTSDHISGGLQMLKDHGAQMVFSGTTFPSPIQRAFMISEGGWGKFVWPENETLRSQELEERYFDAGMFYWGIPETFGQKNRLFPENLLVFPIERHLVHDIDTEEDWTRAELIFRTLNKSWS